MLLTGLIWKSSYYFSTHGCCCACSSFPSVGFCFEPLDAAAAAARALLLKKLAAMVLYPEVKIGLEGIGSNSANLVVTDYTSLSSKAPWK